jgi:predicted O-methyltransferase YrrM
LTVDVIEDLCARHREDMMNVPPADGRLLRVLTEAVGARHVVEIGTSNGYSGLWFCQALRATGGRLTTYEADAHRASLARETFEQAGVAALVTLIEGDAHTEVAKLTEPIDVLFLDADKTGYVEYLRTLRLRVRPGGLILAHNTASHGGEMEDYIQAVTNDPDLETIFVHQEDRGLGITLKKRG